MDFERLYFYKECDFIINLNDEQKAAAEHFTGPALTLAGPGSGKTRVMMERTRILSQKTSMPERILSVTFTNAAADEMRSRYLLMHPNLDAAQAQKEPVFKTVHSYCNTIISKYEKITSLKYKRIESMPGGRLTVLREIYRDINGEIPDEYALRRMSAGMSCDNNSYENTKETKNFRFILEKYKKYKKEHNLIDFDDMITTALEILTSDDPHKRQVRECEQEYFKFIQVDEAQDLTREQFEILQIIAASGNIFVVADDDQSIYGFRGAEPSCLMEFVNKNTDCKLYMLSRNYRSVKSIVNISDRFIAKNSNRFEKSFYSENEPGKAPHIAACTDSIEQIRYIYRKIKMLRNKNKDLTVGILYRNNISNLIIRPFLMHNNEKYSIYGGKENDEYMLLISYILDKIRSCERKGIFIRPPRKIMKSLIENGIKNELVMYCGKLHCNTAYIGAALAYSSYICEICNSWKEAMLFTEKLDLELKQCGNGTELNTGLNTADNGGICLSTVHSSKGLEYDAVFIVDAIMGEFPKNERNTDEIEEERRLFYVAMTRAKKYLYVTYPVMRENMFEKCPDERESIFVSEMKECMREYYKGK